MLCLYESYVIGMKFAFSTETYLYAPMVLVY